MLSENALVIAVLGPTASGKSDVASAIAARLGGEIVSVDSMQVYRGMDIGTAKPSPADRVVPHHLLDVADPEENFSVAEFQVMGRSVIEELQSRATPIIIAGGSGLHFRALVDPMTFPPSDAGVRDELEALSDDEARRRLLAIDAMAGESIDMANPRRVVRALEIAELTGATPTSRAAHADAADVRDYRPLIPFIAIGLDPRSQLADRVEARFQAMLASGLVAEVADLVPRLGRTARQAVGYKELLPVVAGRSSLADGAAQAIRATNALAKRQRTFFRRDPRIQWLPWEDERVRRRESAVTAVEEAMACAS